MKRVLIISPYFPPINAADMQRVRMSLPYFVEFGWEAEVVTVSPEYTDMAKDPLLEQSIPPDTIIHYVKALPKKWTSKLGLGSIAIRSLYYFKSSVNRLLAGKKFDLIFFSTTQFPVCTLGRYWKRRFNIPYIIDMQDPWHSDYYKQNPAETRPPKYWFSYHLNKMLEPIAMKGVGGLMAVSEVYLETLSARYPSCKYLPQKTITFGAFENDFKIAQEASLTQPSVLTQLSGKRPIVYIGRGGVDMQNSVTILLEAFKAGLAESPDLFSRLHFYFIGTSYAAAGKGLATISPVADKIGVADYVTEITDRLPFYQTLNTLADAAALFIPGSADAQYTASKVYPYVLAGKPLLAIFHPNSSVVDFLKACGNATVLTFDQQPAYRTGEIVKFLLQIAKGEAPLKRLDKELIDSFSARTMTKKQCDLFDRVVQ